MDDGRESKKCGDLVGKSRSSRRRDDKEEIGAYKLASEILANGQEGILREINQYRGLLGQTTLFRDTERKREEKYTECFVSLRIVKIRHIESDTVNLNREGTRAIDRSTKLNLS